jgi:hypothetical protein
MQRSTDTRDEAKPPRKQWEAPRAVAEQVRDITEGQPAHHNTADGFCSS